MNRSDVAIIGAGPSGVSAAIYLKRYGMNPVVYEKEIIGGKVNKTEKIENYAGVLSIKGPELGSLLEKQVEDFSIEVIQDEVISLSLNIDGSFKVESYDTIRDYPYVIIASGMGEREFPLEGEQVFKKRGISRCAICDGPFYKNKDVAVIGAGNSAFEEAIYLSSICSNVSLIARREEFRADKQVVERYKSLTNCKIYAPYTPVRVDGTRSIESITIQNVKDKSQISLNISGLFLYIGDVPNTSYIKINGLTDEKGVIITDSSMMTRVKNLYATGDCRDTPLRQVATATSDGAIAASFIHKSYKE